MPTITLQPTEPTTANPFDLWQIEAGLPGAGESFATPIDDDDDDGEAVWSISLPGDMAVAGQTLTRRLETINRRRQATGIAGDFLRRIDLPAAEVSYSIGAESRPLEEEAELLYLLAHYSQPDQAEAFGVGDWLKKVAKPVAGWEETLQEYRLFMRQSLSMLKPVTRIETNIERALLAQTIVRADGDMTTLWPGRAEPAQMALHRQTTQLTLETRQALLLFLAQVSAGAASLATKFYVAQWVALPAAFRFARDVVRRAREERLLARMRELDSF